MSKPLSWEEITDDIYLFLDIFRTDIQTLWFIGKLREVTFPKMYGGNAYGFFIFSVYYKIYLESTIVST